MTAGDMRSALDWLDDFQGISRGGSDGHRPEQR